MILPRSIIGKYGNLGFCGEGGGFANCIVNLDEMTAPRIKQAEVALLALFEDNVIPLGTDNTRGHVTDGFLVRAELRPEDHLLKNLARIAKAIEMKLGESERVTATEHIT